MSSATSVAVQTADPVDAVGGLDAAVHSARQLAHVAGLRGRSLPHLADVDRRRTQLWGLSLLVALVLPGAIVAAAAGAVDTPLQGALSQRNVQLALLAMLVVVIGYVAEREVSLRRLTRLLVEERALTTTLLGRVEELELLQRATRLMHSALDPEIVLGRIAASAERLLRAGGVAILLVDAADADVLVVAATAGQPEAVLGHRQRVGAGVVGQAASRRDALLVAAGTAARGGRTGRVGELMVVPLEHRGQLVGVATVLADAAREPFTEFDLRALNVFADAAAGAITNARAHQEQQGRIAGLLERDRAKDEFLTLVTHELRTPLTSMIGLMTTMAKRGGEMRPDQVVQYAEIARTQGWRLDRLIENLLTTSRSQLGVQMIAPSPVDVGQLVSDAVVGLQRAVPEHPISVTAPAGVHRLVDVDALHRILDNLLSNAAKYTPEGTPVHVSVQQTPTGISLAVADQGPGVAVDDLQTVFDKFTRGPDPYDRGGLGLGLFVVQALAEAHGGRVEVSRTLGGGATFTVWLAAAPAELASTAGVPAGV
jgi:two-component system sensor histidine kinase KdpD